MYEPLVCQAREFCVPSEEEMIEMRSKSRKSGEGMDWLGLERVETEGLVMGHHIKQLNAGSRGVR